MAGSPKPKRGRSEETLSNDESDDRDDATSEEDLQAKDPAEMPRAPQNPVNPGPDPIR